MSKKKISPIFIKDDTARAKLRKKEEANLYNFLERFRSIKTKNWTHAIFCNNKNQKFTINESNTKEFRKLYIKAIHAGSRLHIVEKQKEFGPFVITLEFIQEDNKRYYTATTIRNVIKSSNSQIIKYLESGSINMQSYVMEMKEPVRISSSKFKDVVRIMYPYLNVKLNTKILLRSNIMESLRKHNVFQNISYINKFEEIYNVATVLDSSWPLYGSCIYPETVSEVTHIYTILDNTLYDTLNYGETMNNLNHIAHCVSTLSSRNYMREKDLTNYAEGITDEVIRTDMIKVDCPSTKNDDDIYDDIYVSVPDQKEGLKSKCVSMTSPDHVYLEAIEVLKVICPKKRNTKQLCLQIGCCLHNIDDRLFKNWVEFSKKTDYNVSMKEYSDTWRNIKQNSYTLSALHFFAERDCRQAYEESRKHILNSLTKVALDGSNRNIAKLFMEKYKYSFKCVSIKTNTWYEFHDHRWNELDSASSINNKISDELVKSYEELSNMLYELAASKAGYEKACLLQEATTVTKVIKSLNTYAFKTGVIKECSSIARDADPTFIDKLNANDNLIGFLNGVYDLELGIFREGNPDDNISFKVNYDWEPLDKTCKEYQDIKIFLKQIQTDKEMRDFLVSVLASCLSGSVKNEKLFILLGRGSNGKSKIMELMKHCLGDYYKTCSISLLVSDRPSAGAATPELADKAGVRLVQFDEPEETDKFRSGFTKQITGGDELPKRGLFKDLTYFKPQFKPIVLCNVLPEVHDTTDGIWRRFVVIDFDSKFVVKDEADEEQIALIEKNEYSNKIFYVDNELSTKLPLWKQTFMSYLLIKYAKYNERGFKMPEKVKNAIKAYRNNCDHYQDFMNDTLERTNSASNKIPLKELHTIFITWSKTNNPSKIPKMKELKDYLAKKIPNAYKAGSDYLTHYKYKLDNASDSDD